MWLRVWLCEVAFQMIRSYESLRYQELALIYGLLFSSIDL